MKFYELQIKHIKNDWFSIVLAYNNFHCLCKRFYSSYSFSSETMYNSHSLDKRFYNCHFSDNLQVHLTKLKILFEMLFYYYPNNFFHFVNSCLIIARIISFVLFSIVLECMNFSIYIKYLQLQSDRMQE